MSSSTAPPEWMRDAAHTCLVYMTNMMAKRLASNQQIVQVRDDDVLAEIIFNHALRTHAPAAGREAALEEAATRKVLDEIAVLSEKVMSGLSAYYAQRLRSRLEEVEKELAAARIYMIEADDQEREWSKSDSLVTWIHNFGKDMQAALQSRVTALEEALREVHNLTSQQPDYAKKVYEITRAVLTPAAPKEAEARHD